MTQPRRLGHAALASAVERPRPSAFVVQQAVGRVVADEPLRGGVPLQATLRRQRDIGQKRERRGPVAHLHIASRQLPRADAVEEVSRVAGRQRKIGVSLGVEANVAGADLPGLEPRGMVLKPAALLRDHVDRRLAHAGGTLRAPQLAPAGMRQDGIPVGLALPEHEQPAIRQLEGGLDPFPVFVPVLMRELGNSPRGVSEGGA